jgi:hypothetical protein
MNDNEGTWERRPVVENASEAKRLAIKSFRERQRKKARPAKTTTKLTPSARAYLASEERHQRRLASKRAATKKKTPPMTNDEFLADAKYRLAMARYRLRRLSRRARTQEELGKLWEQGAAYKLADGSFAFPVQNEEDLVAAIKAAPQAPQAERWRVRRYLFRRAKELQLSHLIPSNWEPSGALEGQEHPSMGFGPGGPPSRD